MTSSCRGSISILSYRLLPKVIIESYSILKTTSLVFFCQLCPIIFKLLNIWNINRFLSFFLDFMLSDLFLIFVSWSVVVMAQLAGCCHVWMMLFKRWSVNYLHQQFFLLALVSGLLQIIPVPHDLEQIYFQSQKYLGWVRFVFLRHVIDFKTKLGQWDENLKLIMT